MFWFYFRLLLINFKLSRTPWVNGFSLFKMVFFGYDVTSLIGMISFYCFLKNQLI